MADETKPVKPDFFANREIRHFEQYIKNKKKGTLDEVALAEKEGLNEKQIAQLQEYFATGTPDEAAETETDLESMTKAELQAYADEQGIEYKASWSKAELIAALS